MRPVSHVTVILMGGFLTAMPLHAGVIVQLTVYGSSPRANLIPSEMLNQVNTPPATHSGFFSYHARFSSYSTIDAVLTVKPSQGITGYDFIATMRFSNVQPQSLCMDLGFGIGDAFVQLDPPGLAFHPVNLTPWPSAYGYHYRAPDIYQPLSMQWVSPNQPFTSMESVAWVILIPDLDPSNLPEFAQVSGDPTAYKLTLRQSISPVPKLIPEPASLLVLLGLGVPLLWRRAISENR